MADLVRVNTRISQKMNAWLDKQSEETGLAKSTLVMLALEDYRKQKEAMDSISDIGVLMEKLEKMERQIRK